MKDFLLATPGDVLAGAFGVTAALLLVGGSIALRLQRQSQRFGLMRAAIDKGITRLPGGAPFWLVSMRQGVEALALGIGLLLVGGLGAGLASHVPPPPASTQPALERTFRMEPPPPPQMDDDRGPPDRHFQGGPPPEGPERREPMPDLATQRWHFAQMQSAVSLGALGLGIVLALLGLARIAFASIEKRHEKGLSDEVV